MSNDPFRHEEVRSSDGLSAVTIFKLLAGSLLVILGVALGIYVANIAIELIYSKEPAPLIEQITDMAAEKVAAEAANQNVQEIKLAPDLLKTVLLVLTFFLLIIPTTVASMLLSAGVKLMQGEANEAIAMLAERLKKSDV